MYWNEVKSNEELTAEKKNHNIRCIEIGIIVKTTGIEIWRTITLDVLKWNNKPTLSKSIRRRTITLDVLKLVHFFLSGIWTNQKNHNIRCIEIKPYCTYSHGPGTKNHNIRCIEIKPYCTYSHGPGTKNHNIRCIEILQSVQSN